MPAPPPSSPALRLAAASPGLIGAGVGLALLGGPGLPLDFGAAPAFAALGLATGLGVWRARTLRGWVARSGNAVERQLHVVRQAHGLSAD